MERKNSWLKYDEKQVDDIFTFIEGYKAFISDCKTERECSSETESASTLILDLPALNCRK